MRRSEFTTPALQFAVDGPGEAETCSDRTPTLSVVVPLYDEEVLVPILTARLARALDSLAVEAEVILVDDGSGDGTLAAIARAHAADTRFVGLALSRNFGHQVAITAGLAHARGDAVVVMDGDLQDPPEAIGALWSKLREGYDVVYAVRASRPEGIFKRLAYRAFYRILDRLVAIEIPLDAGDFGIMTRRVVAHLNAMPERRRFVRGLRAWVGFRQTGLPIDRAPRHAGRPKFTLLKLLGLAIDGLVGFSDAPPRWAGGFGIGVVLAGMMALTAGLTRIAIGLGSPPAWFWIATLTGFSTGVQLLFLAILGEYVGRIFQEVNGRPLYLVRRRIGIGPRGRNARRARARSRGRDC
jgi:glycosyltransferase involved in cell wall biosynthesis